MTATVEPRASLLVVEDNRDLCENLAEIFSERGFDVATAFGARSGLAKFRERPPDVVLIDLNLPDGRGIDLLAEVRRTSPETAAVILTGNATLETAVEAVNQGAYAFLLKGGRIEEVLATIQRAAEKVRLERALRDERHFSKAIVSNAALGIAVLAPDGRVLELNRQMRTLLEATAARPEDLWSLLPRGRDEEVEVPAAGGEKRVWRVSTSVVEGDAGQVRAFVAVVADATEERELQRRIVDASRLATIGEMAARVAHEIRNALAGIAGAVRVLGRVAEAEPKREAFSKEVVALIARLNSFVEDLLLYARPLRLAKERVSFETVLAQVRAALAEHPLLRGVAIELADRLGRPLDVDPHHFALALQNLLLNAAQAQKGKGRIRLEIDPAEDGGAIVTVLDDGPGIAPDLLPDRLFEPFASTRTEGTGLGLSTTKRIVEAHGGAIAAANRPEGGARFEIRLPG